MTRKFLAVAALAILFVSVASAQDAKTVVANATKAMGYEGLNTIQYSGPLSHEGAGLGQWISPTKGWHNNTVRDFTRFIDLTAGTSQRNGTSKREGDAATGLLPGGGGLDPSAAPAVAGTANIAANAAFVAKLDITLSPPGFLKMAAAAPNATVRNQGRNKVVTFDYPGVMAPSGLPYKVSGYINNQNMVEKVETAYEDAAGNGYLFGDILVEQSYADYKDFGGVKFPTKITQLRAGVLFSDATIADVKANGAAPAAIAAPAGGGGRGGGGGAPGGAAAPGGGRGGDGAAAGGGRGGAPAAGGAQAPGGGRGGDGAAAGGGRGGAGGAPPAAGGGRGGGGGAAAAPAGPRKIAEGVFVVTNGYRTLAIEMKDGIVLLDAPQGGTAANIAQAKEAIPNKPITHVITTHMHFDHVGGLRTVLADGSKEVTLVTNDIGKDAVEKWFSNPRTLQANVSATPAAAAPAPAAPPAGGGRGGAAAAPAPWPDALAQSGKKVKFQGVKDKWTLKDDTRTIEVYSIKGALHGEDMMVIYLPKEKVIFEADAYNPGAVGAVTNPTANGGQLAFQKLLASELDRLKLDYTTIVSGHAPGGGRDATKQDLMVAIGRVPPPPPAAAPAAGPRGQ